MSICELAVDDTLDPATAALMQAVLMEALAFSRRLQSDARLLIHCAAGISRSSALALAILAQYVPPERSGALLHRLRPMAIPNLLMIDGQIACSAPTGLSLRSQGAFRAANGDRGRQCG